MSPTSSKPTRLAEGVIMSQDDKHDDSHREAAQKVLRDALSDLNLPPRQPVVVDCEILIVPRVFLVHPVTGEKYEIKPRKREEIEKPTEAVTEPTKR
jgi:hypothetical protein